MRKTWRLLTLMLGVLGAGCSNQALQAERAAQAARLGEAMAAFEDAHLELGQEVFVRRCSVCHGLDGRGSAAVPPLRGHIQQLMASEGGASYVAGVVMHGISGPIEVMGRSYLNMMPGLGGQLDDEAIAGALNYAALVLDDNRLVPRTTATKDLVAAQRKITRTPKEHHERRPSMLKLQP